MRKILPLSMIGIYTFTVYKLGYLKKYEEPDFDEISICIEESKQCAENNKQFCINTCYGVISKPFSREIYDEFSKVVKPSILDYIFTIPITYKDPKNAKYTILKRYYDIISNGCCYGMTFNFIKQYLNDQTFINRENGPSFEDMKIQNEQPPSFLNTTGLSLNTSFIHFYIYGMKIVFSDLICNNPKNAFSVLDTMKRYENGVYKCSLKFKNSRHCFCLIKKDEEFILFEPTCGTLKFDYDNEYQIEDLCHFYVERYELI